MIKTEVIRINKLRPEPEKIRYAANIIKRGGLVAFPTETVYGLGANAFDENAIRKVFKAKGRPADNPLIVHIADLKDVHRLAKKPPKIAKLLMEKFWPGPLTIVLKKKKIVPDIITGGGDTVAIRMPDNRIALSLIKSANVPLVAPSANISGRPSPTRAKDVLEDLKGKLELIINGGKTRIGIESTVIDVTVRPPLILRPGAVTLEAIEKLIGKVNLLSFAINEEKISISESDSQNLLKSPGLKYKHYAPNAEVIIVEGKAKDVYKKISLLADEAIKNNKKVGIISFHKNHKYDNCYTAFAGSSAKVAAKRLFTILREMDRIGVDIIISESILDKGIGLAVSDRLKRSAGYNIIKV